MSVDLKVPVLFQAQEEYKKEDSRFLKVKIWLMHLGENFNGSYFTEEAVRKAIPSLANTPIIGYIEEDDNGEDDFSDHRYEVVVKNDAWEEKYAGQAFGIIPETNNAKFEERVGDDGVLRTYLTVEGLMWTKWTDPVKILQKYNAVDQSMELHDEYTGRFTDEGLFEFTDFKFYGACALGNGTKPAMNSASLELFSRKLKKLSQNKMEEFKTLFSKQDSEEVEEVPKTNINETEEVKDTKDMLDNEETQETPTANEDTKETAPAEASADEEKEATEDKNETVAETEVEEAPKAVKTENSKEEELNLELNEAKEKLYSLKEEVKDLKQQLAELSEYKRNSELEELKTKFSKSLEEEKLKEIFSTMKDSPIEEIEKEIFAEIGKQIAFSKVEAEAISVPVKSKEKQDLLYNGFFAK